MATGIALTRRYRRGSIDLHVFRRPIVLGLGLVAAAPLLLGGLQAETGLRDVEERRLIAVTTMIAHSGAAAWQAKLVGAGMTQRIPGWDDVFTAGFTDAMVVLAITSR